ncbi:hypothetical protein PROPHIGD05-1_95 [Mycobacterium phage prophiGD05-1]|nr:hypothetical protein PROPHIGD05-1_95 [Mycobacterium phage prophiGD05-1]
MRAKLAQRGQVSLKHILIARHHTHPLSANTPVIHSTLQQP